MIDEQSFIILESVVFVLLSTGYATRSFLD